MTVSRPALLAAASAAVALLVAGAVLLQSREAADRFAACRNTVVAGGTEALGGDFTLTSETGARITAAETFDRPSLLYFGYTFCPDVCPLDNARNAEAIDLARAQGIDAKMVFISVDPKRDTPEQLVSFTDNLHPDMLGLTGTETEIAAANRLWRGYFKVNDEGGDEFYLVDHMTTTYLVLPEHGTVEVFGRDVPPADMAERMGCFVDAAGLPRV